VTCAIPGAKTPLQARTNAAAASVPELDETTMAAVQRVYDTASDRCTRPLVRRGVDDQSVINFP